MNPGTRGGNPNPRPKRPTPTRPDGFFTTWEVVEASGLSYRMVDYWIRTKLPNLGPSIPAGGSGTVRLWTGEDCERIVKAGTFVHAWESVTHRPGIQGVSVEVVARFVDEAVPCREGWFWQTEHFNLTVKV